MKNMWPYAWKIRNNNVYSVANFHCRHISIAMFNPQSSAVESNAHFCEFRVKWNCVKYIFFFLPNKKTFKLLWSSSKKKEFQFYAPMPKPETEFPCVWFVNCKNGDSTKWSEYNKEKMCDSFPYILGTRNHRILKISYAKRTNTKS